MIEKLFEYGAMRLKDIQADEIKEWNATQATHLRVILPASAHTVVCMQQDGFVWADRTIGASINLVRSNLDFKKLCRMPVIETTAYNDEVLHIATESFPEDRRFHFSPNLDTSIAREVLAQWVDEIETKLLCIYKEHPIGFLALKEVSPNALFVHLAAVEERYRATGAALSLYAKAALITKEKNYSKLEGRISTQNIAVLNLYAYLGANFHNPTDIYLKELK